MLPADMAGNSYMGWFTELHPVLQALFAGLFTWASTALGAALVFVFSSPRRKVLDVMLGMTGGVMLAAGFWGLLIPAIEANTVDPSFQWIPAAVGLIVGWGIIQASDRHLPELPVVDTAKAIAASDQSWRRTLLLVLAMFLHNIPEGLGMGMAFAGATQDVPAIDPKNALVLTLALGIHNFPEGIVVAMPLLRSGFSPAKSFFYGQMSAMVDPIFSVLGALSMGVFREILPYGMGFAAGAMIYVVISEVVPESQRSGYPHHANAGFLFGLLLMMVLEFGWQNGV